MENIFSIDVAKILSDGQWQLSGGGFFLLYQSEGATEIFRSDKSAVEKSFTNAEQSCVTLSHGEVFVGELGSGYTLDLPSDKCSRATLITVSGQFISTLSELYGITDGFSAKAPEAEELFEEIRISAEPSQTAKPGVQALALHRLMHTLQRSSGTRLVRRTALRIKEYIDTHLEEKTDIMTLSRIFFMSKTQIHRIFKDEYGTTPMRYLTGCRIELSKKLLKNERMKLSEIAEALCFSDAGHFSKTFLSIEGILPSEYRKHKQ